ncbi:hypothetical protein IHO40_00145 [Wolbachia endosymbiont of Mansonella ozzardi]|nr:hypothetical protein [Wolbachia endosymbiont of Mansonella ozzardi]
MPNTSFLVILTCTDWKLNNSFNTITRVTAKVVKQILHLTCFHSYLDDMTSLVDLLKQTIIEINS